MGINVGDEKGALLDAAVRRADPKWRSSWAPTAATARCASPGPRRAPRCTPSSLPEANAANARQIWAHAGVADRVTCVVGTIGDGGHTLDALAARAWLTAGALDFLFLDHDKDAYLADLQSILDRGWLHPARSRSPTTSGFPARRSTANTCAAAGQAVAHRRAQGARGVSELDPRPGAGIGVPGRLTRPRVGFGPDFAQRVHGDHGVDLRRGHRGVSQQFLNHPDVGPALQQVGRKRVPQRVR